MFISIGKFQSFSTERHNLQFSFSPKWKKNEVTCILDSLNLYNWMTFIWYPCNLPSIIEKSITSVYFIVETWYLDLCITSAICKALYTYNIKVISEVKGPSQSFFIIFMNIDNRVTTIILLFWIIQFLCRGLSVSQTPFRLKFVIHKHSSCTELHISINVYR